MHVKLFVLPGALRKLQHGLEVARLQEVAENLLVKAVVRLVLDGGRVQHHHQVELAVKDVGDALGDPVNHQVRPLRGRAHRGALLIRPENLDPHHSLVLHAEKGVVHKLGEHLPRVVGDLPTVAGDEVAGLGGRHGEWLEAWEHGR